MTRIHFLLTQLLCSALALLLPASAAWANWGENWGSMVWSAAPTPVPTLGLLGLTLLAMGLTATAAYSLRKRRPALGLSLTLVLLAIPLAVAAGTVSVPNTFVNGEAADADEVNANFDAVETAVNDNDSRITAVGSEAATAQTAADTAQDTADAAATAAAAAQLSAVAAQSSANTAQSTADAAVEAGALAQSAADANATGIVTVGSDLDAVEGALGSLPESGTVAERLASLDQAVEPEFFTRILDPDDAGENPSVAWGSDALPIVTYQRGDDLVVAHCEDVACNQATFSVVDSEGSPSYPSLVIGSDGLAVVSYRGYLNELRVAHCEDLACTTATISTVDASGITSSSIVTGTDGLPIISYQSSGSSNLEVAHCLDEACENATFSTVDDSGSVGYGSSIAIGSDGLPIIAHHDIGNRDLRVAHCVDIECSSATLHLIDADGLTGYSPSIAIGEDGLPIISYYDNSNPRAINAAHCADLSCSDATVSAVDADITTSTNSAITIGPGSLPMVVYNDYHTDLEERVLKIAHCQDAGCASASLATLDAPGSVVYGLSINTGEDGSTIVAYHDSESDDLKVAIALSAASGVATAHTSAGLAKGAAASAQTSADAAQASADGAQASADGAQASADGAQSSAAAAQSTADTGVAAGVVAQSAAEAAAAAAGVAQATADANAAGIVTVGSDLDTVEGALGSLPESGTVADRLAETEQVIGSVFVTRVIDTDGWTGRNTDLVIGADGMPIMTYSESNGGDLMVAHCEDAACSSASVSTISPFGGWVGGAKGIAIGSDELAIISYSDADNKSLSVAHCDDVACSSATHSILDSGPIYGVGNYNSIAIGNDGLAIISYYDRDHKYIKLAHCDDVACSTATIESVSGLSGRDRHATRIAIPSDGLPVVSFWENLAGLKFARCTDPTCDGDESVTLIDGPENQGTFSDLAIGSDGFPVLSYYDSAADDLRVAHCGDLACSSVTITVVDSDGDVGQFNSIAIGEEGFPIISYHDESRGNLKLAFCRDVACSAATFQEIESDNDIGHYTSITIAPNGLPIVGFENETDNQLEVAVARSLVSTMFALEADSAAAVEDLSETVDGLSATVGGLLDCGTLVAASVCPIDAADGPTCDAIPVGSFCEGDGECSTDSNLDNCGAYDWYFKSGT